VPRRLLKRQQGRGKEGSARVKRHGSMGLCSRRPGGRLHVLIEQLIPNIERDQRAVNTG
jgi:hypothetical protein